MAAPELDLEDVDLSVKAFGRRLSAPVIISAMTGGHPDAKRINENLAKAASELGVGMGVGSQRAALENASLEGTFRIVRDVSKEMLVIANIGAAQLLSKDAGSLAERAITMIDADAIAIHLNPLQEIVQPGGDTRFKGVLNTIKKIAGTASKPVMVKETGCGISREVCKQLLDAGVHAIDVSGAGGTSWAAVEHYNACLQGDQFKAGVADTFWDWGIPTAMSLCEVASITPHSATVVASGGLNDGLDMAKAVALGADLTGVARQLLIPAFESHEKVKERLAQMIFELRAAAMLTNSRSVHDLQRTQVVLMGGLLEWMTQRGMGVGKNARR